MRSISVRQFSEDIFDISLYIPGQLEKIDENQF